MKRLLVIRCRNDDLRNAEVDAYQDTPSGIKNASELFVHYVSKEIGICNDNIRFAEGLLKSTKTSPVGDSFFQRNDVKILIKEANYHV